MISSGEIVAVRPTRRVGGGFSGSAVHTTNGLYEVSESVETVERLIEEALEAGDG